MIPRWLDRVEYPFVVHTLDTLEGRLSYVDAGRGRPVLFLHGNLTWSFLYRKLIESLSGGFRCIALDHLGFGLSEKKHREDYTPEGHVRRLTEFIDALGLDDVTLVMHDFGGPIGLHWAERHPERVRDLVLFNTWMWPLTTHSTAQRLARIYASKINRIYYSRLRASPWFFLPPLVPDSHLMPRGMLRQYLMPHEQQADREGPYGLAEALCTAEPWFQQLWDGRGVLREKPTLMLWGEQDEMAQPGDLERLVEVFPISCPVRFPEKTSMVPQTAAVDAAREIQTFLRPGDTFHRVFA